MADANQFQIVLSFKAVMDGLNSFVNGYKSRMAEVEAFNQKIVNGGAAIQKMIGTLGVVLGAAALRKYTEEADAADQAQRQLLRTLQRVGETGAAEAFIAQSKALAQVTNFSQDSITAVQRLLVTFGLSAAQAQAFTEKVLDFAQETGQSAESAALIVGRTLVGQTDELGRWKIALDSSKGKVDALSDAFDKAFAGAARGGVANAEARKNTASFSQATEDLGRAINKVIVPIQTQLVPLIEWVAEKVAALSTAILPIAGTLGKLAAGVLFVVGTFAALKLAFTGLMLVINPLRAAIVLLTGTSFLELSNIIGVCTEGMSAFGTANFILQDALDSTAGKMRLITIAGSLAGAALAGWQLGSMISDIEMSGLKIKDWVAIAFVYIGDKFSGILSGLREAWAITSGAAVQFWDALKMVTIQGVLAVLDAWNKLPFGQKLKVDLSPLRAEFDATAAHFAAAGDKTKADLAAIAAARTKQIADNASLAAYIYSSGHAETAAAHGAGASGSAPAAPGGPRKDLNAEHFGLDAAKMFQLQTQLLAAQNAGNQAEVDRITDLLEQLKLKQELVNLDTKAAPLVAARLAAEQAARAKIRGQNADEIAFQQQLGALEIQRAAIEANNALSDLEKHRQLVALMTQENALLDAKIAKDEALLKAGVTDQDKTRLLQEIDSLRKQLAQNTGAAAPAQTLQQRDAIALRDLSDPAKHYQSAGAGAAGGAAQSLASIGTAGDNAAEAVTGGLNSALQGTSDLLDNIFTGAKSMKEAWGSAILSVGQSFSRMISDMVAKLIWRSTIERALTALGVTTHVAGEGVKTAATTVGVGTRLLLVIKEALASVYHGAVEAFEALASIPYVGPFLGAAAMAAAIAGGVALVGKIGHADGAIVRGPGGPRDDLIPALLSNGEAVTNAAAVARFGEPFFHALNAGVLDLAALPGNVARQAAPVARSLGGAAAAASTSNGASADGQVHVSFVGPSDRSSLETLQRNPHLRTYVVDLMRQNRGMFGVKL